MEWTTDATVYTLIAGAGTALASAIGALWGWQMKQYSKLESKLNNCEDKHAKAQAKEVKLITSNALLEQKVNAMESRIEGYLEAKQDMQGLSKTVELMLSQRGGAE